MLDKRSDQRGLSLADHLVLVGRDSFNERLAGCMRAKGPCQQEGAEGHLCQV